MSKYFSFIIAFFAIQNNLFAAEAGMPQLDPKYWASQAFWLILVFSILYISIAKFYLPKIKNNLDNRENRIKDDLEDANKFKELSETKLEQYKKILEDAKKEVIKAQKDIGDLKKNSITNIQKISENIASNIIESISGDKLNESSVKATVEDVSKKNLGKYL